MINKFFWWIGILVLLFFNIGLLVLLNGFCSFDSLNCSFLYIWLNLFLNNWCLILSDWCFNLLSYWSLIFSYWGLLFLSNRCLIFWSFDFLNLDWRFLSSSCLIIGWCLNNFLLDNRSSRVIHRCWSLGKFWMSLIFWSKERLLIGQRNFKIVWSIPDHNSYNPWFLHILWIFCLNFLLINIWRHSWWTISINLH